jgi:transposase-like protein
MKCNHCGTEMYVAMNSNGEQYYACDGCGADYE